jgi:hypothetical protein
MSKKEIMSGFNSENLCDLMSTYHKEKVDGYVHILREITGSDPGDGGADNYLVIQRVSDEKYFHANFTDWDAEDENDSVDIEFEECSPRYKTITVYE